MTKVGWLLLGATCLGCDLATGLDDFEVRDEDEALDPCADLPTDTFALEIDDDVWRVEGVSPTTAGEVLTLSPPAGGAGFLVSLEPFDLSGCQVYVELVTPPGPNGYASFVLDLPTGDFIGIATAADGTLRVGQANEPSLATEVTNAPAPPGWWRIRHAEDALVFETSLDLSAWEPRRSLSPAPPLTDVYLRLGGGTFFNATAPATLSFDNVNTTGSGDR